jgi:imidazole glycerol-phosphate synthase subunit HisF
MTIGLKQRVVGVIVVRSGWAVQSIGFNRYLPVGRPEIAVEYLNRWGIDEIVLLDIDAAAQGRKPDFDAVHRYARLGQVPLTVGGGITNINDIESLIRSGADKVAVNWAALENRSLLGEGATLFGSQCIVASLDAKSNGRGEHEVFIRGGREATGMSPADAARRAHEAGAGEILINSVDRDGTKKGYDLGLIRSVMDAVDVPVVACGGVGHPQHLLEGLRLGASGVAAANFWHFSEHSVIVAKRYLAAAGASIRLDTYADYHDFVIDERGRAARRADEILDHLRFDYIPEEVI